MSTEALLKDRRSRVESATGSTERQWTSTMASEDPSMRVKARTHKTSARVRLLTLTQAAERVQLSRWTLRRAIERGELDGFRFGRRIRVSEEALEAWIKAGVIEPKRVSTSMGSSRARRSKLAPNHFRQIAKESVS